ncbi:MAG TPA: DUF4350 domain-containing protein [Pyrinomonadaceae bacterium]|nr:DUF4350 domain-containing protein [Pyrinomonadaceae bacterium]
MRQKLAIVGTILLLIGVLFAINAATYVSKDETKDFELSPNRSTYHAGPTGTRALYDFLNESGSKVMRWRETPDKLLGKGNEAVRTFVIIGDTPVTIDEDQAKTLLVWVERGGRLVLVDRRPEVQLVPRSGEWRVTTEYGEVPSLTIDPANAAAMTENVKPVRALQPTALTKDIDSVQPSKFAAGFSFVRLEKTPEGQAETPAGQPEAPVEEETDPEFDDEESKPTRVTIEENAPDTTSPAPVVHLGDPRRPLLIDYPHGRGRIIMLGDPYLFTNGGISLKDNLQLAINVLAAEPTSDNPGLIAFDEYHQGRGATRNEFVAYFSGTPVLPLLGQIILLILLILWTRGRRFARPIPLVQVDRRSALEFVASMAELQQRAGAFDLALENIYARTRRVLARYAGTDYNSSRTEIASRVAARSSIEARSLEVLMRQCEGAINGEAISERQSIFLVKRLREIEGALGLRMRTRDIRQTQQH